MQRDRLLAGRYRLLERLGSGGMSAVHRAYDEVLERDVAVKVLVVSGAHGRRRIRAEAKAAARLSHPHVTNVYDYGESPLDGVVVPFVVLELLDGHTLEQRLNAGPLPPRAGLRICAEVASALAAAHAQGLVHRDIKPGNVMLTPAGAKMLDFGIAAAIGDPEVDFEGRLLGTPAYLAPERLAAGEVLPASDVYALGLLLHRVLTGRLPWAAEAQAGMLRASTQVEPDPLPDIHGAEIQRLGRWCLAHDPADRPPAVEAARILRSAASAASATSDPAAVGAAPEPDISPDPIAGAGEPHVDPGPAPKPDTGLDRTAGASGVAVGPCSPGGDGDARSTGPVGGATVGVVTTARPRSWRRRRAVLAVGGAVVAAMAMAGSLGDSGTRERDAATPGTSAGPGGATAVGLPQPDPTDSRPATARSAGSTPSSSPSGPTVGAGGPSVPSPAASTPRPNPTRVTPTPTPTVLAGVNVNAQGGTVAVRCVGVGPEVLAVTPAPGYRAQPYDPGPAKRVQVELTSAEHRSEIRVHCANGRPKPKVKERAA
ncbi:serine/threonine-protein kinase [Micromonospora sp. NPDC047527]|uniref:serine/threonine-protein kinase n=1 Tax=unclassified Micromonospora TaxID=2617518 RepID=UPI0033F7B503